VAAQFDDVAVAPSISATTSLASISRTVSAPSFFSTRFRCRP
jgi:hypothetical protein